jgi:hypothetical protein
MSTSGKQLGTEDGESIWGKQEGPYRITGHDTFLSEKVGHAQVGFCAHQPQQPAGPDLGVRS